GYAGLKDRRAIAVQWFSVPQPRAPVAWSAVREADFEVLEAHPHTRKLPRGALAGNRFTVRLGTRQGGGARLAADLEARLADVARRGVPNYFGPQRALQRSPRGPGRRGQLGASRAGRPRHPRRPRQLLPRGSRRGRDPEWALPGAGGPPHRPRVGRGDARNRRSGARARVPPRRAVSAADRAVCGRGDAPAAAESA